MHFQFTNRKCSELVFVQSGAYTQYEAIVAIDFVARRHKINLLKSHRIDTDDFLITISKSIL